MTDFIPPQENPSYDPVFFAKLYQIEDNHFWFRTRNRAISTLTKQITNEFGENYRVLEIGCGTGNTLRILESICGANRVVGMDLFSEGLFFAQQRIQCSLVQGDILFPPFQNGFHLIGLFDVLEHLPEDQQILNRLQSLLAPGGKLLLTVPAHPSLWSYFDQASHHCRRYTLTDLESKLIAASLQINYITYYMATIFPLVWLGRKFSHLAGNRNQLNNPNKLAENDLKIVPVANNLLAWILNQENRLIGKHYSLPIGTSLLAVAQKSQND